MKTAKFAIALALLTLSFIEVPGHAQNRRRRSRSKPPAVASSEVERNEAYTPEEWARVAEECGTPGRPKPAAKIGENSNALLCGKAISLPKPAYPPEAKAEKASGTVEVEVVVDETGRVVWAEAIEGHPLLRAAAVNAACQARFSPVKISGRGVRAGGVINYNFQL